TVAGGAVATHVACEVVRGLLLRVDRSAGNLTAGDQRSRWRTGFRRPVSRAVAGRGGAGTAAPPRLPGGVGIDHLGVDDVVLRLTTRAAGHRGFVEDFGVDGVRDAVVVGGGAGRAVRGAAEGAPTAQAGVRAPVTVVGGSFGRIGAAALVIAVV